MTPRSHDAESATVASPPKRFPARLLPGRYPLLWVLAPMLVGYAAVFAECAPAIGVALGLGWFFAGLAWAGVRFFSGRPWVWQGSFLAAVACVAMAYAGWSMPPPPTRAGLPPREAVLTVRVDELFISRFPGKSGIGTVVSAPGHLRELEGIRIRFSVTKGHDSPAFDLGAEATLRGVFDAVLGEEGFARYLRLRGVDYSLTRGKLDAIERPASAFRQACTAARGRVERALAVGTDPVGAARLAAMTLGRTGLLPEEEREDFRRIGATHIFAISGLHITGIAAGLLWCLRRIRIRDAYSVPTLLVLLWLYVQMAGAPPSAMRAWWMTSAMFAAPALGRAARPAAGWVLAATVALVLDPGALREPGFLLSYWVVGAILFYAVPLVREVDRRWRPWRWIAPDALGLRRRALLALRKPVVAAVATGWAASFAGAPLVAALFGLVSPVGFFANLMLVPLAGPPVVLGFLSALLATVGVGWATGPFNAVAAWFMSALAVGARAAAALPGGSWELSAASPSVTGGVAACSIVSLLALPIRPDRTAWRVLFAPVVSLVVVAWLVWSGAV